MATSVNLNPQPNRGPSAANGTASDSAPGKAQGGVFAVLMADRGGTVARAASETTGDGRPAPGAAADGKPAPGAAADGKPAPGAAADGKPAPGAAADRTSASEVEAKGAAGVPEAGPAATETGSTDLQGPGVVPALRPPPTALGMTAPGVSAGQKGPEAAVRTDPAGAGAADAGRRSALSSLGYAALSRLSTQGAGGEGGQTAVTAAAAATVHTGSTPAEGSGPLVDAATLSRQAAGTRIVVPGVAGESGVPGTVSGGAAAQPPGRLPSAGTVGEGAPVREAELQAALTRSMPGAVVPGSPAGGTGPGTGGAVVPEASPGSGGTEATLAAAAAGTATQPLSRNANPRTGVQPGAAPAPAVAGAPGEGERPGVRVPSAGGVESALNPQAAQDKAPADNTPTARFAFSFADNRHPRDPVSDTRGEPTAAAPLSSAGTAGTTTAPTAAASPLQQPLTPGRPEFSQTLSQQLLWMASQDRQRAEISVNPRHLGPVEVSLSMEQGKAHVQFFAHDPGVRDALEQAMPRLRELFDSNGLQLGQASVADQSQRQQQGGQTARQGQGFAGGKGGTEDGVFGEDDGQDPPQWSGGSERMVDHYV